MRIVIADDVDLVSKGIEAILKDWHEVEIVGVYQAFPDLLRELPHTRPDLLLLDDRIDPEWGIVAMLKQIQDTVSPIGIIVLGGHSDGVMVRDLFRLGVQGYLCKRDAVADLLIPAIHTVRQGKVFLSPTASADQVAALMEGRQRWKLDTEAVNILHLLAEGYSVGGVAQRLKLPVNRVYWVRSKLRRRFGVDNNEGLISRATAEGILP
ncbi:MAG: response regulator transcription factor [Anaerolinea sp.]|nr:response regulator transcription factor [Anaerolinea sp.]